jgi:homospermidine synthase
MIENPKKGIMSPDDLPHKELMKTCLPYLGPFVSAPTDWTPLTNWDNWFRNYGLPVPPKEDTWQFSSFWHKRPF